jgi:tRNA(Ile)-lysidine synthase
VAARARAFGPHWLAARLAELIPDYPNVSLCVALSGGLDSTALLAALAMQNAKEEHAKHRVRKSAGSARVKHSTVQPALRAVHIDHSLHANSPIWSEHCRALARQLGVPLKVLVAKVDLSGGVSLEAAARDARYALLADELAPGEVLLTAHHEEDQFETVLLQLFRGAGLAGLSAMPPLARFASGWHARPMLQTSRADIAAWAHSQSLTWVEDDTNADERLDRNYLRRRVWPLLQERWPGAAHTVSRSARHIAEAQGLLEEIARADVERAAYGAALSAKYLRTLTMERRRNALRYWIAKSGHTLPDTTRLDEVAGPALAARMDANPCVTWAGTALRREADLLTLTASGTQPEANARHPLAPHLAQTAYAQKLVWAVHEHRVIDLPGDCGKLELQEAARGPIDVDALPAELTIRWRTGGERLRPRRGGPSKSLKNLLQSTRVPHVERARVPLMFHADRLLAVGDFWSDATIQADESARRRARIVWHRYPSSR